MKYFVVSDLHSFYTPLAKVLEENSFNKDKDTLVVLGDVFDRGEETLKVYEFLTSLPNKILVKGNHEYLYEELLKKGYPDAHDFYNGTVRTFCHIAGIPEKFCDEYFWATHMLLPPYEIIDDPFGESVKHWTRVLNKVKKSEITKWIKSDEWKNYFELKDYVMVHSWIPLIALDGKPAYCVKNREFEIIPHWRKVNNKTLWKDASCGSPVENLKANLWQENKRLIVGHWHTNFFHEEFEGKNEDYSIFENDKIVALDGCVAYTKKVNLFIIEE